MVNLIRTDIITQSVQVYNNTIATERELIKDGPFISHNTLCQISVALSKKDEGYDLINLLKGSSVYVPPKPEKKKDPEYEARMNQLRVRLQEQEYQDMIASTVPELSTSFLEPFETKEFKQQISVIINVLFSVISVGFAAWTWGGASLNTGKRLLLSLFAAVVVLIAEVVLYMGYLQRVDDARKEERRKKEIKEVIAHTEFKSSVKQSDDTNK
ncbi:endoplasmic reticulum-based factor for assembly of V-ATPase-domain-containing protein [Lipomyces japonicus]|uniref:endoplasmic reticulum-based factor for assembly of V-ATPase-domain-containing protein n=1 Tax=Lipomyces japonicus TaxID=56871 RepID=UPI0034CF5360